MSAKKKSKKATQHREKTYVAPENQKVSAAGVLNGLEQLFESLHLKPFSIECHDAEEEEATWSDHFEERIAVVARKYKLSLIEYAGQRRLVMDVCREVRYVAPDDGEFIDCREIAGETRVYLTDHDSDDTDEDLSETSPKMLAELQRLACYTLAHHDLTDVSNYGLDAPRAVDTSATT